MQDVEYGNAINFHTSNLRSKHMETKQENRSTILITNPPGGLVKLITENPMRISITQTLIVCLSTTYAASQESIAPTRHWLLPT
jgi:hypothetical protein